MEHSVSTSSVPTMQGVRVTLPLNLPGLPVERGQACQVEAGCCGSGDRGVAHMGVDTALRVSQDAVEVPVLKV